MSDMLEKLYNEEQDTDGKFVAAAKFFVALKEKTALKAPPKAKKVSVKSIPVKGTPPSVRLRQNTKRLVESSGGNSPKLNATEQIKGQVSAPSDSRSWTKGKAAPAPKKLPLAKTKSKAKVKVVIAAALSRELEKNAMLLPALAKLTAKGKQVAGGLKSSAGSAAQSAKEVSVGVTTPQKSRIRHGVENVARGTKDLITSGAKTVGNYIPGTKATARGLRSIRELGHSPVRVSLRRDGSRNVQSWLANNPKPTEAAALGKWTDDYAAAKANAFGPVRNFDKGVKLETATGANATKNHILKAITGSDGNIGVGSALKGAQSLGLFNPATLATLGIGSAKSLQAAKAAKAAAQKDKMMKWGLGGAAGLGALYLLKNRGKKQPQQA